MYKNYHRIEQRLTISGAPHTTSNIGRAALLLLAATLLLVGCPDDAGNSDAIPTEATKVQRAFSTAINANSITLNWDLPTDTNGYVGVTISAERNAGSFPAPVELDNSTTTYQVTGLDPATDYVFIIATRYTDSGKNNSVTIMTMTTLPVTVQNIAIDQSKTTSDSITLTWENPSNTRNYTGITISANPPVGNLTSQTVAGDVNTLVISTLTADTDHTLNLTFATQYSDNNKSGGSSMHVLTVTTQSNSVSNVMASGITSDSITLSWEDPEDITGYTGVVISAVPFISAVTVDESTVTKIITGLNQADSYAFTLATQYNNGKSGGNAIIVAATLNPIDIDADALIDISFLEDLHNMRHNLAGTSYKNSDSDSGTQCGVTATTTCTGYELTRSLDFADAASYNDGMVNDSWRPQNSSGIVPMGSNADSATNGGWEPIGDCGTDTNTDTFVCGDQDDTPFATRFEGNGFVISNLYARNTDASNAAATGLFAIIDNSATIRNIGILGGMLYSNNAGANYIGGLAGYSDGTITASYAHNSASTGGAGNADIVGGLVGYDTGTIIASYASSGMTHGGAGMLDAVGGLAGYSDGTITASYTTDSTVNGGMDGQDSVGGLVGEGIGTITASYAHNSTVSGGMGNADRVGGLVGHNANTSTITAAYASGTVDGGADNNNIVGGLVGDNTTTGSTVIASYAIAIVDGGSGSGDRVGSLIGRSSRVVFSRTFASTVTASYGFGTVSGKESAGNNGTSAPSGVTAGGIDGARQLTAPSTATTAVGTQWNSATDLTLNAWDFGTDTQSPALRYADYDGAGNTYGCGSDSAATIIIPNRVPDGAGGTITTDCGITLLPGQTR